MSLPTRSDFQTAMKGDRLRPLRSAQAVAVHQDGIGGRGHPVERCRFFPDQAKFGAVRRRHGLRPRRSGPRRLDAGRRAVRKLRGRPDPSRAFGGIKGATTRLTAPAYWKFESSPLQRRVNELSVPLDEGVFEPPDLLQTRMNGCDQIVVEADQILRRPRAMSRPRARATEAKR